MKRFLHFIIAASAALSLFFLFSVVSSAETIKGTISNYSCIKFMYDDWISIRTLYDDFNRFSDDYIYGFVFYESNGSFVSFTNNNIHYTKGTNSLVFCGNTFYPSWLDKDAYSNSSYGFIESSGNIAFTYRYGSDGSYNYGNQTLIIRNCTFADFPSFYSDTFYAVYFSSPTALSTSDLSAYQNDILNGLSPSHFEASKVPASAKFLKLVDSSADSKLNICDWMRSGYQYPIVDFQINDNNFMDSYILKVGSNSTKTDLMQQLYQEQQVKDGLSAALNFSGAALGINIPNGTDFVKKNVQLLMALTTCDTWDYDTVTTISSDLFSFSDPNVLSCIFSINLSDYLSIVPYNIYRLDIVSKSSAKILATCYFTSERAYSRGNSGYGVKQYTYGSVSDANSDSSSNDYSGKPPTVTGNIADSTNVSDFVSQNFNNNLSNLDISSTFGSFQESLNSVSSFFQACWGLFPPAIWAIILCGISLIIILRVLGR